MSWNPEINWQEAVETACHNAIQAQHNEAAACIAEKRSFDSRRALAAALEEIHKELIADRPDITLPFALPDLIIHLRRTAAPQRKVS